MTVTDSDNNQLSSARADVSILASNHWLSVPAGLSIELLAAHVLPNAPEVGALLADVSRILLADTGDGSLQGYQAGPERVDEIVRATYEAMQGRQITYSEPPASWAETGQKVRSPRDVLDGRMGTCLDLAVTMAAALEQAGIRPLIWVLKGHALLAYWRDEVESFGANLVDAGELINRFDLGVLGTVETTALCLRSEPTPFSAAHNSSREKMSADRLVGVLDVVAARRSQVLPLPAVRSVDGGVQVFEYRPAGLAHSATPQLVSSSAPAGRSDVSPAPARVQQWKNSLLDLSLRNRLINFSNRGAVSVRVPSGSLSELEDRVQSGKSLTLLSSDQFDDIHRVRLGERATAADLPDEVLAQKLASNASLYTDVRSESYDRSMQALAHKARTIAEETGANNLYLSLGTLVWQLDDRELRSPLVLVPVKLTAAARRQSLYQIKADDAAQSSPNYCLLEKLYQSFGFRCPEFSSPPADSAGIDLTAALQTLRVALADHGLPFHVEESASVSILQFAKFRLWKDLDESWQEALRQPLVHHLALSPTEQFVDPVQRDTIDLEALAESCPIPADGSQLTAIGAALQGRSFVLEGPPGTGKSQTIANLLSVAMSQGKKVLFVAEKRAALNVVRDRIDAVGMGELALDLHDRASSPQAVRRQIMKALDLAVASDRQGLQTELDIVRSATGTLRRYSTEVHAHNNADLSLYSARTELLAAGGGIAMEISPETVAAMSPATVEDILHRLRTLPDVAQPAFPSPNTPWGFVTALTMTDAALRSVGLATSVYDRSVRQLREGTLWDLVDSAESPAILKVHASILATAEPAEMVQKIVASKDWPATAAQFDASVKRLRQALASAGAQVNPIVRDADTAALSQRAHAADESGWWGRKKRQLAVGQEIGAYIPGGVTDHSRVSQVADQLASLQEMAVEVEELHRVLLMGSNVPPWNSLDSSALTEAQRRIAVLARFRQALTVDDPRAQVARRHLENHGPLAEGEQAALVEVATAWETILSETGATETSIQLWRGDKGFASRWMETGLRRHPDDPDCRSLQRWLALRGHIAPLMAAGLMQPALDLLDGTLHADDATLAFRRGLAAASIAERLRSTSLEAFDGRSHEQAIARHGAASRKVRKFLTNELARRTADRRGYAAQTTSGQVGELRRELSRQRGGLKVRELMAKHGDLIISAMPCVLVSPDSLARFFPLQAGMFDLVVFDEASQIRVADAIGAIARGQSVVVVGDSKQMPPTSVAESQLQLDEDDEIAGLVADEESILTECVQARLERLSLTWHYRSQDESLIAFSNSRYYDGRLGSFPSPLVPEPELTTNGHGISLVRVDGQFDRNSSSKLRRTNMVEARAIVEDIRRRFAASPEGTVPSIGVVTFNQPQRALIESLIRETDDSRLIEALDSTNGNGLFIKNLENVQGDERDVVLFSTAFSANEKGILPLNFGPLTMPGGERRLNVAITRARRQVVLFSSFNPEDLRVQETSSLGIKHLRAYLELAQRGAEVLSESGHRRIITDRHRDEVADALCATGLVVTTDVGLSDFRVDIQVAKPDKPERPLVAVLLDGEGWGQRLTVGDRDAMPTVVLRDMMHWPAVARVWLPEWLQDSETVVARIKDLAETAQPYEAVQENVVIVPEEADVEKSESLELPAVPALQTMAAPPRAQAPFAGDRSNDDLKIAGQARVSPLVATPAGDARFEAFTPWEEHYRGSVDVLDALPHAHARRKVAAVIDEVVAAEGPIHGERLAKHVAGAFGLSAVRAARSKAILQAASRKPDPDGFYWPDGTTPGSYRTFRPSETVERELAHISPIELANAMRVIGESSAGILKDELYSETLHKFGLQRRTSKVVTILDHALELAIKSGRLVWGGDYLKAGPTGLD
ncbi:DUF3320 domain-containing protein [Luteococcus sp. OSA5]|uniref:DUF3320 domain-containing protein n=1 Tax=Luteococcus sp. OSA5 TaxID=3401630 RepID=UPI003B42E356